MTTPKNFSEGVLNPNFRLYTETKGRRLTYFERTDKKTDVYTDIQYHKHICNGNLTVVGKINDLASYD